MFEGKGWCRAVTMIPRGYGPMLPLVCGRAARLVDLGYEKGVIMLCKECEEKARAGEGETRTNG